MTTSQNNQVLDYIKQNGSITAIEAIVHLKCLRLSARILELRESCHAIKTDLIYTKSRKRIARYSLAV